MRRLTLFAAILLIPVCAAAEMPSEGSVKTVAEAWLAKKPAPGLSATVRYGGLCFVPVEVSVRFE
jgi:hypothetical protein